MIRSQIQLIADNLHNFIFDKSGDIYSAIKNFLGSEKYYIQIIFGTDKTTLIVSGSVVGLTFHEQEFLCRVFEKCKENSFVDYEELAEIIS